MTPEMRLELPPLFQFEDGVGVCATTPWSCRREIRDLENERGSAPVKIEVTPS